MSGSIVNCSSLNCSVAARYTSIDSGTREQLIQTVATCPDEHCYELKDMIHRGEIEDLTKLETMASKVLQAHREARTFPPTYPHPLIGEVDVWLLCINWIMNNLCKHDAEETLAFVTNRSPPFFRTCISDSFHLLDVVDNMV